MADPFRAGVQGACGEVGGVRAAMQWAVDQAGAFEHLDGLGGAGERDLERRGKLADGARLLGEGLQHGAPRRIGEGLEHAIQVRAVRDIGLIVNHGVEYTPANGIVNRLVKYFPTARVADQDGRLTLKKIGAGKLAASAAPAVRLVTVGAPGWPGARRGLLSRRLPVAGVLLVQLHRRHRALGAARSEEHTSELQSLMRISYA